MKNTITISTKRWLSFIIALVLVAGSQLSYGQLMASWGTSWSGVAASPLNAGSVAANISVATLSRVSLTGVSSSARYNSSAWASGYLEIVITANTGYALNLSNAALTIAMGSSGTGPNGYNFYSSVDNFSTSLKLLSTSCSSQTSNAFNLPTSPTFNGLTTIKFRIYAVQTGCSGTFGSGGTGGPQNLVINGQVVPAAVALSSATNPSIPAGSMVQNTLKNPLYNFQTAITNANATIGSVAFTTAAGYAAGDVGKFQLWFNASSNSLAGAAKIGSDITATLGAGSHSFSGLTQVINAGTTGYFWITADVTAGATINDNITVNTMANTDLTFGTGTTKSGSASIGGTQTIIAPAVPSLAANSLTAFGNVCINTIGGPNKFTISGSNLTTADVTVGAVTGFTYATASGGPYTSSLSLSQPGGTYSQDIFVEFNPTLVQAYDNNIPVGGGGAPASVNVFAAGSGVNTIFTVTTSPATNVTTHAATLPGIANNGCTAAITAYGIEYSTTNGFVNGTGTQVAGSNLSGINFSVDLSSLTQGTAYYFHAWANNGTLLYGAQQSFTPNAYPIYQFSTAVDGSPGLVNANVTATNVTPVGFTVSSLCGAGNGLTGLVVPTGILTYSPSNTTYANVDITPASGYILSISSVSVSLRESASAGTLTTRFAYSTDGGVTWIDEGPSANHAPKNSSCGDVNTYTWNLTTLCGAGNGATVGNPGLFKFRIYPFANSGSGSTLQIENVFINGDVSNTCNVTASISGTTTICTNNSTDITFTGTPSARVTYTINGGPNQFTNLDCAGSKLLNTGPLAVNTTYTIVSASLGSCSQSLTGSAVVSLNPLPTMAATPISISETSGTTPDDSKICNGDGVTLTANVATGAIPFTYKWSGTLGTNSTAGFIPALGTPSYIVTVTDNNGCTVNASKSLTVNALPNPSITETDNSSLSNNDGIICLGDAVNFSALPSTGMTYSWSASLGTSQTATASPIVNSTYTVTLTDVNGCSATAYTGTITVNPLPTVNITPTNTTLCSGDNVNLEASGTSENYVWMPSGDLDGFAAPTVNASPTTSGTFTLTSTYTVIGTDENACSASNTASVTVKPLPPLVVTPQSAVCTGFTTATLTASGASGYSWAPTANLATTDGGVTETAQISQLTFYTVTGTGTNGCTTNQIVPVATVATGGVVSPNFSIICSGGTKTLTVAGAAGHDYQWQISANNSTWSNISGATNTTYNTTNGDGTSNKFYRLMAQSNTCWNVASTTAEVDISNPVIAVSATNITDNSLTLNWGPTGTGNYSVSYSGTSSATQTSITPVKTITGLSASGNYNFTVTQTGVSGCSASGTLTGVNTLCAMPTGVTLSSPANSQILVSWTGVPGANYRVYYRPLFAFGYFFTKDVSGVTSALVTKQGPNNLYGGTTYEVYVSRLDCPNTGAVGQGTSPADVTTLPTVGCTTPVIDSVRSLCPVQIEVFMHPGSSPSGSYNVYLQRITPTILAVNSYGVSGDYFTINVPYSGDVYLIAADSKCAGGTLSSLYVYPGNVTIKPICNSPANLVLSNPTCHGFTASWNGDQCLANSASGYDIYLRVAGTINYNSYGASLPANGIGPNKTINWLTSGRDYQIFVRSVYNCNGFATYGPSSQVQTVTTLSGGCRDEEDVQPGETKPAVQQYSADNQEVFSIYPNPNSGEFVVDLSRFSTEEDAVRVEVISMIGQTIMTHLTTIGNGHMNEYINLPNNVVAGTYIVRLTAGKNVYTSKINISK